MSAEFRCPGEDYSISRSVHLARLAVGYPKCRACAHNTDTGSTLFRLPVPDSGATSAASLLQSAIRNPGVSDDARLFFRDGVRGVYLNDLSRHAAMDIAGAFASRLWDEVPQSLSDRTSTSSHSAETDRSNRVERRGTPRSGPVVVIAHDERPSSPDIVTGVGIALRRMGCQVVDIGLTTRPCFWYAVDHLQAAGGVHVTGAGTHLAWTGMDFVLRGALACSQGHELDAIQHRYRAGYARPSRRPGSQRTFQAAIPYEAGLWKNFHALRPLKIQLACANRPQRDLIGRIFHKLACRLEFVDIPSRVRDTNDPDDADVQRVSQAVRGKGAHLGVLVDDDAQRCALFDERGHLIPPLNITRLLAEFLLQEHPHRTIVLEHAGKRVGSAVRTEPHAVPNRVGSALRTESLPTTSRNSLAPVSISTIGPDGTVRTADPTAAVPTEPHAVPNRVGAAVRTEPLPTVSTIRLEGTIRTTDATAPALVDAGESFQEMGMALRAHDALFGGGESGRYWFRESFPTCDAILTIAHILQALSRSDAPFSEVAQQRQAVG